MVRSIYLRMSTSSVFKMEEAVCRCICRSPVMVCWVFLMCSVNSCLMFDRSGLGVIHLDFILSLLGVRSSLMQAERKLVCVVRLI